MWCKFCGQDVPGIAGPKDGQFSCARCTNVIADNNTDHVKAESTDWQLPDSRSTLNVPTVEEIKHSQENIVSSKKFQSQDLLEITMPRADDDWQYDQDVNYLMRITKQSNSSLNQQVQAPLDPFSPKNLNQSTTAIPHWHTHLRHTQPNNPNQTDHDTRTVNRKQIGSLPSQLAWAILLFGVMGLVCGGTLMIWSIIAQRPVLWELGLPVSIASQAGLLLGLILQIERIWRNNQKASNKIETVDQQISDLKETTTILSTSGSGSSNAFYSHISQGASNELLLADLKGQMDMLTRKISK